MHIAHSIDDSWTDRLDSFGSPPRPRANLRNAILALEHAPEWRDVLAYDQFAHNIVTLKPTPWGAPPAPWTDRDNRLATSWLQRYDIQIHTSTTADAVLTVAESHGFNPLLEYLTSLEWDGWARVDKWLNYYLGVKWNDYSCAVGRAWLISGVARAVEPGCKADHCLILEGPQGRGKSSALRALAGMDFFTDYISSDLSSKEAAILCIGKWIIEFSELEGIMHKAEKVETVKAFLSRSEDNYRPVYGRYAATTPRQCIFAATTNREVYMPDESGNRRFWPVAVGEIDLNGLHRDRDQLWAEAYRLYIDGHHHWLDEDMERVAAREQASRYDGDPWQPLIELWIGRREKITIGEVLKDCLDKKAENWNKGDHMRVARCIKAIGGWQQSRSAKGRWYDRIPG